MHQNRTLKAVSLGFDVAAIPNITTLGAIRSSFVAIWLNSGYDIYWLLRSFLTVSRIFPLTHPIRLRMWLAFPRIYEYCIVRVYVLPLLWQFICVAGCSQLIANLHGNFILMLTSESCNSCFLKLYDMTWYVRWIWGSCKREDMVWEHSLGGSVEDANNISL